MQESQQFHIEGTPVVAEQWADSSPPIMLLHAGVSDRRSWYPMAGKLSECGRTVAYDMRGFGDSPAADEPFLHVDDLRTVMDQFAQTEPVLLVGSSMGGQVAIDAALQFPDRVRGLVLLAPAVSGAPEPDELDPHTQHLIDQLQSAEAADDLTEMNRLETWLWLDGPSSPEGRVRGPARDLVLSMNEIVLRNDVAESAGESNIDAWQQLERIDVPVVVAWGDLDVPFLAEQGKQLVRRIPKAQGYELPGVAHLSYLEAPALVADLICDANARFGNGQ